MWAGVRSVVIFLVTLNIMCLMDNAINEIAKAIQEKFSEKEKEKVFATELAVFLTVNWRLLEFLGNIDINRYPAIPNACYYAVIVILVYNVLNSCWKAMKLFITDTVEFLTRYM